MLVEFSMEIAEMCLGVFSNRGYDGLQLHKVLWMGNCIRARVLDGERARNVARLFTRQERAEN